MAAKVVATVVLFTYFFQKISCNSSESIYNKNFVKTEPKIQENAVNGVITRLLGDDNSKFFKVTVAKDLSSDGKNTFTILKLENDTIVTIIGSSGVAAAWGFHYYLKTFCKCHVSWDGDQLQLPEKLPDVNITISSIDKFIFYQNVCTSSYSFVWWDWSRWEREIDWMALNGINLALAFTAQEAIWQRVYDGIGLESDFTGPAFLAWNRMGNLRGFGSGLNETWHENQINLQHKILNRMRELGITPVLPAFAGFVPNTFHDKYPSSNVTKLDTWNQFSANFCCPYLLSPSDRLFSFVGRIFLREYISEFGTNHIYNCDTFNENNPPTNDPSYLAQTSRSIFDAIYEVDPLAIWMLQGWMFINPFWGNEQVEAYVTSVPIGRMLILDLQSDLTPQYERLNSYFGQPFIWCTLHNFGGQLGLYGHLQKVNSGVINGRNFDNSTMVGIGITPEGIDQNYIMYEFTLDSAFRSDKINLSEWVSDFVQRRYGGISQEILNSAWQNLLQTAYNYDLSRLHRTVHHGKNRMKKLKKINFYGDHIAKNILTKSPSLTMTEISWYDKSEMYKIFDNFIEASKETTASSNKLFKHDLIDVTRQTIQFAVSALYKRIVTSYRNKNLNELQDASTKFLAVLDELDVILGAGEKFLLGKWLSDAKKLATNSEEEIQYEYNARNQITLWGPNGEIRDYAAKQWSGLIADYYKPRWNVFINAVNDSFVNSTPYNSSAVKNEMFLTVEQPFTFDRKEYPIEPVGDPIEIIQDFSKRWNETLQDLFSDGYKRNWHHAG